MNNLVNPNVVKDGLNKKSSLQLLDILSFAQDNYIPTTIPIIEEILIERGITTYEIETCKNSYARLKTELDNQPKLYRPAKFWPRFFNYVIDHFICYGTVYLLQSFVHTETNFDHYYSEAIIIYVFYYTVTLWLFKATIGMLIFGLTVIQSKTKKPVDFFYSIARGIFMVLNFITAQLSNFWMISDKKKRTVVDILTETSVVYNK